MPSCTHHPLEDQHSGLARIGDECRNALNHPCEIILPATIAGKQIAQAAEAESVVLFIDHIQDPQNLGAILRSADAAGVCGVMIPKERAVAITPAVVRASAGGTEHMRVAKITNLVQVMKGFKDAGFWMHGLDADPEAKLYSESDFSGKVGIVVGSEGKGMGRLVKETCDFLVKLPLEGRVSSLNASVATGIVLYEALRQRSIGEGGAA
jgi:23S rRNA (guanosine2251-2'-O)-methyltransferase